MPAWTRAIQIRLLRATVLFDNISEADALAERLKQIRGVEDVTMNIMKQFIFVDSWLDDLLESRSQAELFSPTRKVAAVA